MIELEPPLRLARESDASQLADLVNYAGEGLPYYIWTGLAEDGQDPWKIGRARQAEKARDGQIVVVDFGSGAVASLTGYKIGAEPVEIGEDFPALFRPLQELENQALESWYVNVLACYPEHRGKGYGSRLLDLADEIALAEGLTRMSVIVAGDNIGARRLYERKGYKEAAQAPCQKEDWETDTECWVLLMKSLS
ncbi:MULTISPECIES: GNAT family N-acetyltransferase [unclassified Leisingera]|uniref:GNAT family N-acetyltransferase n=1 Tax=unclassified Leisingera TaxID=2614906 RepID=UPI00036FBE99|nr:MULTISPECIES: GNAT family N-acetyltransferase [unclassified Leisingera]KIC24051.1 GCN5 family acetyltransferase [Leisingera sp. ANG-S3]KIC27984.1 GCN5 family acetyltransferase [Leisingera sp. ANG-S5]KIC52523.1 GCN5 family acetyltransferase [Leisingera sp. ANG-S]KID09839.1 GCN5 family acetyltransferase [Leisingera sp. ANG1]